MIKISPSILSSDYSIIKEEFQDMERCGADWLHIDVMDGHFVPNITLGAPLVKCWRKCSCLTFDVHLMISDPIKYIPDFINAGADVVTFHIESNSNVKDTIELIKSMGAIPAIALKPKTDVEAVLPYLEDIGMVLIMTVEPGFGGQIFMSDMMPKLKKLRDIVKEKGLNIDIQVDGGVSPQTVALCAANGANVIVAGSAVFGAADRKAAITSLRQIAQNNYK